MGVPNPAIFLSDEGNKKVQKAQVVKEIVKTMIKESVSLSDLEEEIVSVYSTLIGNKDFYYDR